METKFKKDDRITAIERGIGLEDAVVIDIVEYNNKQCYKVSIPCGFAYIPIDSEVNYKLKEKKDGSKTTAH